MKQAHTLIVGASFSGLASAACLQKKGVDYLLLEKSLAVVTPWRNHYERLHLHTNKGLSHLPYKKFDRSFPRYPGRVQMIEYAEEYQRQFGIQPLFNTEVKSIRREGKHWITTTNNETFQSECIIMATGPYGKPRTVQFKGMETFRGKIIHSYDYKRGSDFKGQKVLVVGFGNSACEIAIDLYEQGAVPVMSVRSPTNVFPREFLGIPILYIALIMSRLSPRLADALNDPLMRMLFGDITKIGLKRMPYGIFQQIKKDGTIPLLDIGTIKHIRQGHIKIQNDLDRIEGNIIHFLNERKDDFDAIVAAIGYDRNYAEILEVDCSRFDDLKQRTDDQKYFGKDGLYFCGYWVGPTGLLREISLDAKKIAKDIASKRQRFE
jgi:indole-3-pyruvate monooxygenase